MKIGILVRYEEMLEKAKKIVKEQNIDVAYMKVIENVDSVNEARAAVEAGAQILVARGYQAMMIKKYTNIPLVEIRLHAQEIGLLLKKARMIAKKDRPKIGLIAFKNMLCDLSWMEELFQVDLYIDYIEKAEEIVEKLHEISKKNPDVIIGGEMTCNEAEKMGYPALFYESTEESIVEALQSAKKMIFAAETEKQNNAQFETILDTSFNGIIKINGDEKIIVINKLVENLVGKNSEDVIGLPVKELFPELDKEAIQCILQGKRESYMTSVNLRGHAWIFIIAPIQYDDEITGAIISLQKISETIKKKEPERRDMFLNGYVAQATFQHIYTENQDMKKTLELAKVYALSNSPVLFYGEEGTEYYLISEAIHNNSPRKSGPYVSVNLRGTAPEQQVDVLFGGEPGSADLQARRNGAFIKANNGTLFIKGIEYLDLRVQHQICRTLLSHSITKKDAQPIDNIDVRLMVFSKTNLRYLVKAGKFSEELYYLLSGLMIKIPPLNERPEDLRHYFEHFIGEYSKRYHKYFNLTKGGLEKIRQLSWKGNLIQLQSFCERLVLTSEKRNIDEVRIQKLYEELYPYIAESDGESKMVVYQNQEAVELGALLEKYHGNRGMVAKELGISTTTLWRRIKKYGIEPEYKN